MFPFMELCDLIHAFPVLLTAESNDLCKQRSTPPSPSFIERVCYFCTRLKRSFSAPFRKFICRLRIASNQSLVFQPYLIGSRPVRVREIKAV